MAKDRSINALNGNLFDLIERLTNPDVTPEEVELLTKVSDSVADLAKQITDSERMVNERVKCPVWAESAAVDASGYAHWFNCEVAPCYATGCFDAKYTDNECIFEMKKIGSGYDTTNWQQSAIDRGE